MRHAALPSIARDDDPHGYYATGALAADTPRRVEEMLGLLAALTQEQADTMLAQMEGRYEWMLDNMGAGYGMMGGRGGMMGGSFGRQGRNGRFTPGGCHGNFAPAASQNKP